MRGGQLRPGDRLPAVRELAAELGVSPATVAAAYGELRRRGITTGAGRAGTTVRAAPPLTVRGYPSPPPGTRDLISGGPDPSLLPVIPALPGRPSLRSYADPPVSPALRPLAAERFAADGVDAAHLAVTGGALDAIERVLGTWLTPGDRIAVEDPGHPVSNDLIAALGYAVAPVPVDGFGMTVNGLWSALARGASAVLLTPRAQSATGAAWDQERAAELADVLRGYPAVGVIEDDHAAPVAGVGAHTVCAGRTRWATIRSVSKSLGPDLRLAVLAGDSQTVSRVSGRQALGTGWVSYQLQETVAQLWSDPVSTAAVAHAAEVYRARRDALRSALGGEGITATGRSGFTCWIPVADEGAVASAMASAGWAVAPGRRFRIASPRGIRISVAALPEADAAQVAADLAAALRLRSARTD